MNMWLMVERLCLEDMSSSMAMSAAAGGGEQSIQDSEVAVGIHKPWLSYVPPSIPCPLTNQSAGLRG
jgi:hypothetical protein